jgi:hypothetical protein
MTGAAVGSFVYGTLPATVNLAANTTYVILSQEVSGGDSWLDNDSTITTTSDASIVVSAYTSTAGGSAPAQFGAAGHAYVGLDFKYRAGAGSGIITVNGSPGEIGPVIGNVIFPYYEPNLTPGSGIKGVVVNGTVTVRGIWINGDPSGVTTMTAQWMMDDHVPLSPPITTDTSVPGFKWFPYTFDTHTIADGTHSVYARLIDCASVSLYGVHTQGSPMIVSNGSLGTGPQTVFTSSYSIGRAVPPAADSVAYTGVPNPVNTTYPFPYAFSAPASARGGDLTRWRDRANLAGEFLNHPRDLEYIGNPQFVTTKAGGVFVQYLDPLVDASTNANAYSQVIVKNAMDGTRLNNQVSNISTFAEAPAWLAGGGCWLGVSDEGRFYIMNHSGNVTTLAGMVRDRTKLTLDPTDQFLNEAQIQTVATIVGTFPPGVDLGGAVDLVVDPRNDHVFYIVKQMDNCIVKVTLTGTSLAAGVTANVTVFAGSSGAANAYVEAPGTGATNARFAQPTSLVIADTTLPNGDLIGTIYVSDVENSAIRKISPDGLTVSTLYGGTVGPAPPSRSTVGDVVNSVTLTSLTWSATAGGRATVVAASPTTINRVGCSVTIFGAVNNFGQANINVANNNPSSGPKFYVDTFTDNQHFTLAMPLTGQSPGAFGGTITLHAYNVDIYSPPGTVSLIGSTPGLGNVGWTAYPGTIRFSSAHHIMLTEFITDCARDIDLSANTIRRIGSFDNTVQIFDSGGGWMWGGVDAAGTCGPVDDIILAKFQSAGSAAHYFWRLSWDGSYTQLALLDSGYLPTEGQSGTPAHGGGHYPWAMAFSRTEGRFITSGTSDYPPTAWRLMESSDIVVDILGDVNFKQARWLAGKAVWETGTVPTFPWLLRPGFTALWGWSGNGHVFGHTWEDLMRNTALGNFASSAPGDIGDQNLAAYIRAGMGGVVPRPEITGNDMRDLIYYIRRNTLGGSGVPGGAVVVPGPDDPDTVPPVVTALSAVRNSATSITVTWTTNKPTIGCAAGCSPAQFGIPGAALWPFNVFSPAESTFSTSHSATITGLPSGMTPIYYTAVAKDNAGNCVYSVGKTIT